MESEQKLTKNQSLVRDRLLVSDGPMSAYDLLDELRPEGLKAPLQIYRALEKLQELNLVHRLESLNCFVACAEPRCHTHDDMVAFAICETCGDVSEFGDVIVQSRLKAWTDRNGFRPNKINLEIRGRCASCDNADHGSS